MVKSLFSQTVYFNRWYDFNGWGDIGGSIITVQNGYFLLASSATPWDWDYLLLEVDSSGNVMQQKRFSEPNSQFYMMSLNTSRDSNLVLLGYKLIDSLQDYQLVFDIYDIHLDTIISKVYGEAGSREQGQKLIKVSTGGYLVTGYIDKTQQNLGVKTYLLRLDELGNIKWWKVYNHGLNDWEAGNDIVEAEDGGFYLCGFRLNALTGDRDILLIRTDSLGNELWEKTYGGDYRDWGGHITKSLEGGYLIAGLKQTYKDLLNFNDEYRGWLIKIDDSGNEKWSKLYQYLNYRKNSLEDGIIQLSDSSYVSIGGVKDNASKKDRAWIVKTDRSGNIIWQRIYTRNLGKNNYFYDFKPTPDGGFIVCGTTWNQSQDAWLVKLDSFGCDTPGCQLYDAVQNINAPKARINIYPNPSSGIIQITLPPVQGKAIGRLYNALGQAVLEQQIPAGTGRFSLDLSALPRGWYVLRLQSNERVYSAKLILE